ncbi:outer membrane beta-barrel protein [Pedobacter caeni]|uniref:Outer membrane receptor for ferrienterochelin and colicins n=1 Tax=Pedobacter caeni TaxID=288992 RepID=A0A1M5HPB7_9SPHI|nr:outer membrane beta-barrel protein [Pedobacter caeni]SHG17777.1 Outer membrane receptor for ferrienterochelin and colicins [Pedobacter caeni]
MKTIPIYLCLSLFCFLFNQTGTKAQIKEKTLAIRGNLTDSISGKPLSSFSVHLSSKTAVLLKTSLTDTNGRFMFSELPLSEYFISAVSIGYQSRRIAVPLQKEQNADLDMGNIRMLPATQHLAEVRINSTKPLIKQEIDRISYDLQADPDSKAYSVLEMMRKVPLLSLDAEDHIQLKGSSNYKILINGKPSGMVDRSPREILRSMPASSIQKIEVITIPPAKYDAEGLAGIINIITNRKTDNGYNGNLNINESGPRGGPGFGGSFGIKQGKIGLSAFFGGSIYDTPETESFNERTSFGSSAGNLRQQNKELSNSRNGYLGLELSYEIDSLQLISAQFNRNLNRSDLHNQQLIILNGEQKNSRAYDLTNDNKGKGLDLSLNYQLGFKRDKSRLLTFSYRYSGSDEEQQSKTSSSPDEGYLQQNGKQFSENTLQLDYIQRISKIDMEAGIKSIFRSPESDFQYHSFDNNNGNFELKPLLSDHFQQSQKIFAAYNTWQFRLKDWGFKAGIRLEQTRSAQNHFFLAPALAISKKVKINGSLNFGFTQRIQRPGIYQLNPFVDRSNPNFESTGNPDLKPIIGNVFQLSYSIQGKAFLNFGLDYNYFSSLINQVSVFDPLSNITRATYQNTGHASLSGANFSVNYPISPRWNISSNSKLAYAIVEGMSNGGLLRTEGLMYVVSGSTGYSLETGWRFQGNFSMNGGKISLQRKTNAYFNSSFSISKDLIKKKLSFSAVCSNPFQKYRNNRSEISGPDFLQITETETYFRNYSLRLNYTFGKLKEVLKKNKRGIKNDDISN